VVSVSTDVSISSTIITMIKTLQGIAIVLPVSDLSLLLLQFCGRKVSKHLCLILLSEGHSLS
jgi:hypothetical protein